MPTNNYFYKHPLFIYYKTQDGTDRPSKTNLAKVIVIFRRELYTAESEPIVSYHRYLCSVYKDTTRGGNEIVQRYVKHRLEIEGNWFFIKLYTFKSLDAFLKKYLHPSYIEPEYRFVYRKIKSFRQDIYEKNREGTRNRKEQKQNEQ